MGTLKRRKAKDRVSGSVRTLGEDWEFDDRIGTVFVHAVAVLGTPQEARRWFTAPQMALGGVSPLGFCETEPGLREVDQLLGRIEHGVLA